ncbi:MAG: hypothetical protein JWR38_2815 [Mucilaginibacter sp.]|nr:hypothetical protein [Mucilaginibacter sp.]
MTLSKKNILLHVITWVIFICYELAFVVMTGNVHIKVAQVVTFYVLNISLFYFNAYVLLNFAFFKTRRRYFNSAFLILPELLVYLLIKYLLDNLMTGHFIVSRGHLAITKIYLYHNIYRGMTFIGLSMAYFSTASLFRSREEIHEMESGQLRTIARNLELENKYISVENAFLQNQISPHLLFNSLSFIHNAVYLISEQAGKGVMRLAELMRYSLASVDDTRKVALAREVAQVENLIALCGMRFPSEFFLRFRKKGRLSGTQIIPLVLITLVENMMKHGDIGEKKQPAKINLEVRENRLLFETHNKKRKSSLYQKSGFGLINIKKRLDNFYKDRYILLIRDMDDFFTVTLKIEL